MSDSKTNKKILLINPPETGQGDFSGPPLGLLYLAGTLVEAGILVKIVDGCLDGWEAIKKALLDFDPDIVGITCLTPGRHKALKAARLTKEIKPGSLVVMGGVHPTIMYRQILENYPEVDICVLGEGEETLLEIAKESDWSKIEGVAFRQKNKPEEIILTRPRKYASSLDELAFPAWELVDLQRYPAKGETVHNGVDLSKEVRVSVIFSRGCVGRCHFCSTWWIWRGWRHRSVENMVKELELLFNKFGIRHFCFADDTLTVDHSAILDLCDEIIKRGLKIAFHVTTRVDCVDEAMLKKLSQAGCYNIAFGVETAAPDILQTLEKGTEVEMAKKAIKLARAAGIKVTVLLIAGNVGETIESVNRTVNFLKDVQADYVGSVGGLWILPGTKLYAHCKQKKYINDDFWLGEQPYKLYNLEYSTIKLNIFDYAFHHHLNLSRWWVLNFLKCSPLILSETKKKIKFWLKKLFHIRESR